MVLHLRVKYMTRTRETKAEHAPKNTRASRRAFNVPRLEDGDVAPIPAPILRDCQGSRAGGTRAADGCEGRAAPHDDRPVSPPLPVTSPVTEDRMRPYQMGTWRVVYLHNLGRRERQFHSCADVPSVSIRHTPPTRGRTCQSYLSIRGTPLICPLACYRP